MERKQTHETPVTDKREYAIKFEMSDTGNM